VCRIRWGLPSIPFAANSREVIVETAIKRELGLAWAGTIKVDLTDLLQDGEQVAGRGDVVVERPQGGGHAGPLVISVA